jgi:hypothetical protein
MGSATGTTDAEVLAPSPVQAPASVALEQPVLPAATTIAATTAPVHLRPKPLLATDPLIVRRIVRSASPR